MCIRDRRETFSQRAKEEAEDYRYFAEPDLPPLTLDDNWIVTARAALPELPQAKEARYTGQLGLSPGEAAALSLIHISMNMILREEETADYADFADYFG